MIDFIAGIADGFLSKDVVRKKNIPYVDPFEPDYHAERHSLNVFTPINAHNCDVLIFIHGGEWDSGSKNFYGRIGKGFCERNVVFVAINYRLAPEFNYKDMALDVVRAVKWVTENIEAFGGNVNRIFLSGHSAGGYLAALTTLNNQFFKELEFPNPLKGLILIDCFLLDLYEFFTITDPDWAAKYYDLFGKEPEQWKAATPMYYLKGNRLPIQAFLGSKTYPGILLGTDRFRKHCELENQNFELKIIRGKAHRTMITQMFLMDNPLYDHILNFMKRN